MGISVSTMLAPPKEAPDGRNADLGSGHQEKIEVKTPTKAPKRQRTISSDELTLDGLPEEVLYRIVHILNARDNYALASTCFRLQTIVEACGDRWQTLFKQTFGEVTQVTAAAALLAGGWKQLNTARCMAHRENVPWERASEYEIQAAVNFMVNPGNTASPLPQQPTCIIFLVDGSGSVTEDDFACMTSFIRTACAQLASSTAAHDAATTRLPAMQASNEGTEHEQPAAVDAHHVALIQFSNDCRVELSPTELSVESLLPEGAVESALTSMQRMNGGTNIAAAVQRAGALFNALEGSHRRVIGLLTDGRIDSYQSREAGDMVSRCVDEQGVVALHAFGVGRGVDRHELLRIISAQDPESAADKYLPLMTLDDAPW